MRKKSLTILANLYPTDEKPYFGTFVKNIYKNLDDDLFEKDKIVLPDFGSGLKGYLKFYFNSFKKLLGAKGIVYIHYVSHSALPALLAIIFNRNIRIVLNYHGSDAFPESSENAFKGVLKRIICKWANSVAILIVVPSYYFATKIERSYNVNKSKVFVSPSGGYDKSTFYEIGALANQFEKKTHYLFAGRMIEGKGCMLAAKAAIELSELNTKATFTFLGNGPKEDEVRKLLKPLINNGRCNFKPSVSQDLLANEFRRSTFFMFPSMREGESLGLVLVEAMACGCIPITINQGAIDEILGEKADELATSKENYTDLVKESGIMSSEKIINLRSKLINRASAYERCSISKELSLEIYNACK